MDLRTSFVANRRLPESITSSSPDGIDYVGLASDDSYEWARNWRITQQTSASFFHKDNNKAETETASHFVGEPGKIYGAIVDEMWKRGYKNEDVGKVIGGNLMRVYEQVWG